MGMTNDYFTEVRFSLRLHDKASLTVILYSGVNQSQPRYKMSMVPALLRPLRYVLARYFVVVVKRPQRRVHLVDEARIYIWSQLSHCMGR